MAALLNQITVGLSLLWPPKILQYWAVGVRTERWDKAEIEKENGDWKPMSAVVCQPEIFLLNLMSSPLRAEILEDKQRIRLETWPQVICLSYLSPSHFSLFSLSLDFLSFLSTHECVCVPNGGWFMYPEALKKKELVGARKQWALATCFHATAWGGRNWQSRQMGKEMKRKIKER